MQCKIILSKIILIFNNLVQFGSMQELSLLHIDVCIAHCAIGFCAKQELALLPGGSIANWYYQLN